MSEYSIAGNQGLDMEDRVTDVKDVLPPLDAVRVAAAHAVPVSVWPQR